MEQNSNECKPIEKRIDQINVYLPTTSSESLIDSTNSNTSHSVNEKQEECFKKPNVSIAHHFKGNALIIEKLEKFCSYYKK